MRFFFFFKFYTHFMTEFQNSTEALKATRHQTILHSLFCKQSYLHTDSCMYCLWLLSPDNGISGSQWQRPHGPQSLNYLLSGPYQKLTLLCFNVLLFKIQFWKKKILICFIMGKQILFWKVDSLVTDLHWKCIKQNTNKRW